MNFAMRRARCWRTSADRLLWTNRSLPKPSTAGNLAQPPGLRKNLALLCKSSYAGDEEELLKTIKGFGLKQIK